jgi:hypothetical protein
MRSMLQLVGGVAVAGVVAAGSTAFTAAGFTNGVGSPILVGGTVSPAIVGAVLKGVDFTYDATNPDRVTAATIRMTGDGGTMPLNSRVTIVSAATTKSVPANEFYCTPTALEGAYQKTVCTFGSDVSNAAGYVTGLSSFAITVQGPLVA